MQISLTFNPAEDKREHVSNVVDAVYGVKTNPNAPTVQTAATSPASAAPTSDAASQTAAPTTANQSANAAPVAIAEFPNATTAPTQPAPQAATHSPAGVELDKNGIPWDARIHSGGLADDGTHKKNKDGSWSKKKGVSDLDVSNITKELQNLMAATIGNGTPPAGLPTGGVLGNPINTPHQEAVPLPGQPDNFVISTAAPSAQQAPQMPAPGATAPVGQPTPVLGAQVADFPVAPQQPSAAMMPVPMPMATVPTDFASLAQWMAPNMQEAGGKLSQAHVEHFCRQCNIVNGQGVGDFSLVINRPDAIAWLHQAFVAQIAAAQ